jgi:hypothetical protein
MNAMRSATSTLLAIVAAGLSIGGARASETEDGRVQIPLEIYTQLVQAAEQPAVAPAGFALGKADLNVQVTESEGRASAEVTVSLSIQILEDRWVLVPILPAGTPVISVAIDGQSVQLINAPGGLAWGVKDRGSYAMQLRYHVDARARRRASCCPFPRPRRPRPSSRPACRGPGSTWR